MTPEDLPAADDLSAEERELLAHWLANDVAADQQRIAPTAPGDPAPLSFSQRQLWILDQLRPGEAAYHLSVAFRAIGRLDLDALAGALTAIVARHEILRTTFEAIGDEPRQRVNPPAPVALKVSDLGGAGDAEEIDAAMAEARAPFDLARGPLFRARVLRVTPARHVLILTMHHIVSDGWSIDLLYRELALHYDACRSGRTAATGPLPVQYRDFASWQQTWLTGEVLHRLVTYWRRQLDGVSPLQLPMDRRRHAATDTRGAQEVRRLDRSEVIAIDALARQERATRFMALLAAFSALLARYGGTDDVVVGSPMAGRDRAELAPLVGYFVNLLPLRVRMGGRTTFRDLMRQVRDTTLAAYEHQDLPFDVLADSLPIEKPPSGNAVFQVTFSAQDVLAQPLELPDLWLEPLNAPVERARFDLEAHVLDDPSGLRISFVYNVGLFEAATIERMLAHYMTLLRACVTDPDQPVLSHALMSGPEANSLSLWNRTDGEASRSARIPSLVGEQASRTPGAVAVADRRGALTYGALDRRASQWAHWMRQQGVRAETLVGVLLDRSTDLAVAQLAVLRAGAAYVPLDPAYPRDRLAHMAADAGVLLVLTSRAHQQLLAADGPRTVCLDADVEYLSGLSAVAPDIAIDSNQLAYVVYTSGSTGTPKGVGVPHAGLENLVQWHNRRFAVTAADRATLVASVGFDASVWELWPYLVAGACVSVVDDETRSAPDRLWAWLRSERISMAFLPTPLAEAALREGVPRDTMLRHLLTGGDRLSASVTAECPLSLVNNYGPTENTVVSTSGTVEPGSDAGLPPSIGRPIDNVRTYVLDARMLAVPVGVVGELYVGGRSLARGYLGRAAQTGERFVPDPFSGVPGSRLYRTGDLVRWRADGTLDFVGRRDGQVKIRGFRIELGDVEAALARLPGVHTAVAAVRRAGDERRLVGYLVPAPGPALDLDALRDRLRRQLPEYMVPAVLVPMDALPLTANGKVDRHALPEPVYERAADGDGSPRTDVEATLVRLWSEVLRLERVGIHDNFFDVGGDSVLSIQIASRASRAGIRLSPRQFFEHQTIAELAAATIGEPAATAPQGRVSGPVPLTPIQRWFLDQEQPRPDHFCQSVLLEVSPDVAIDGVRAALEALIAHHDTLRSRFTRDGVGWQQEIAAANPSLTLVESDLSGLSPDDQSKAIERSADHLQGGLRLAEGRIFQAAWFTRGEGRSHRLLLVVHHLVVDAVSWRILIEDLQSALDGHRAGLPVRLPPKTTSFQQWAHQLRGRIAAAALESERAFWDRHAAPRLEPLPVDATASNDVNTVGRSVRVSSSLTPAETGALLRDVPRACGARAHEALLTAVASALHGWSGHPSVRIDIEGHGRQDVFPGIDLSRTVGWFTVVHPLTLEATAGDVWASLANVRDAVRSVPLGGLGYGLLRDGTVASPESASVARSEISFNYLGQIDRAVSGSGVVTLASESAGAEMSGENRRPYLLEINARVFDGRLTMTWTFCPEIHARRTIDRLASDAIHAVRTIIADATRAPRVTLHAAAFPLARLDPPQLARLAARYAGAVIEDIYPLTPLQHGMLVHSLARPGSGAFVTQIELVLDGDIKSEALRTAWEQLQQRHAILRTGCSDVGAGEFRQVVVASPALPWTEHDWSGEPEPAADERLRALLDEERRRGFGLDQAPLMRLSLVEIRPRRFHLVWTHHHALLDGWSVALLLEELVHLYEACLAGRELREVHRPGFRDYAQWLFARNDRETASTFWRSFLGGFTTPTRLSVDQSSPAAARMAGEIVERERWMDASLTRALADAASRRRVTLNTVVQGAWALLLSRYSGESDVVFGTALAGRPADLAGVERMIGLFLNGLPMRIAIHDEQPMAAWLSAIQRDHVELRQHEHDALADIHGWSDVPPGQPLFETTLAFENYPVAPTLDVATRRIGIVDFRLTANTSAALHLRVVPGDRLRVMISHDRARFDDRTVEEMLAQLEAVFRQFAERPDVPVGHVSLLTPAATPRAADRVGPRSPEWAAGAVHEQIVRRARVAVAEPAIDHEGGTVTYCELDTGSNRLAHALRAAGVRRGHVVAVHAPRGAGLVVALLGVLRTGAAFTILDPAYPARRLSDQLQLLDLAVILHAGSDREAPELLLEWKRAGAGRRLLSLDAAAGVSTADSICEATGPDDLAYVAFTSGSSGQPKAVLGKHESLAHYATWLHERWGLGAGDRVSMLSALAHDPLLRDIFPPLQLGATLCIPDSDRFERPGALSAWMAASRVTCANLTPAMGQLLLERGDATTLDLLRLVLFVGEALPLTLVDRLRARAPGVTCINLYGATETQQALAHFVVPAEGLEGTNGIAPVGSGLPGVQLLVRRANGDQNGVGEVGEVWMWSPLIARGYLGDLPLTAARFVDDPCGPGSGRAYRTGDRGRVLPGGDVLVLGRTDELVKIRGFRVEPGEIEAFLIRQPDVRGAAVIARRDRAGEPALAAYVTGVASPSDLRRSLRAQFPEYMVPAQITHLDQLPRTATGKLDRRALASREGDDPAPLDRYVAPETPVEQQMAGLWAALLHVDRIGMSDRFFDLGGHSIAAARLVAQVRDAFGVELRIADVFERPGLAELSALVAAGLEEQEEIVSGLADEIRRLSPEELRSFLEDGFGPEPIG